MKNTYERTLRYSNYDLLRISATIAVIFIHANWRFFEKKYQAPQLKCVWVCQSLINIVTRYSVPCFVMLSGAFILCKDENKDIKSFYKKTVFKIFLPAMIIFFIECSLKICMNKLTGVNIFTGLTEVPYNGAYHFWYLYMLLGIYALAPIVVMLRDTMSWKSYRRLGVALLVWAIVSQTTSTQRMAYSIGVVVAYIPYFILGDVIRQDVAKKGKSPSSSIMLIIINVALIFITFLARGQGIYHYISKWNINFFSPTIALFSINVFTLTSFLDIKINLEWLASKMFYTYLFHSIVLSIISRLVCKVFTNELISICTMAISTFCISIVCAVIFEGIWNRIIKISKFKEKWYDANIWRLF